jgi:enolase
MTLISQVTAREILDSRGTPTIEVDVRLDSGAFGRAAAPSGGSIGQCEAREVRDGDPKRYAGQGVRRAVAQVKELIAPTLVGLPANRATADAVMIALDGTSDRAHLGANTMLAVSIALIRALCASGELYESLCERAPVGLPVPMFNVLNGGAHADNHLDFQEFMLAPVGAPSFAEALHMGVEVYGALRSILKRAGKSTAVGDEGGFAPNLDNHSEAPDLLMAAIEHTGLVPKRDVVIAIDVAASELYENGSYIFRKSMRRRRTTEQMIRFYELWLKHYPLWSIEDGLADTDAAGWQQLTETLGHRVQLVGDDLFVTNAARLREGMTQGVANAVLIKLNQVGTVTETLETIAEAQRGGYGTIVSHRAGETADDFIADLAVATGAGQIKAGAPVRGERVAKYNRLLRIEESLGAGAHYMGHQFAKQGGFRSATASTVRIPLAPIRPNDVSSIANPDARGRFNAW